MSRSAKDVMNSQMVQWVGYIRNYHSRYSWSTPNRLCTVWYTDAEQIENDSFVWCSFSSWFLLMLLLKMQRIYITSMMYCWRLMHPKCQHEQAAVVKRSRSWRSNVEITYHNLLIADQLFHFQVFCWPYPPFLKMMCIVDSSKEVKS